MVGRGMLNLSGEDHANGEGTPVLFYAFHSDESMFASFQLLPCLDLFFEPCP